MTATRDYVNQLRAEDGLGAYVDDTMARVFRDMEPQFLAGVNPKLAREVFERRFGANPVRQEDGS